MMIFIHLAVYTIALLEISNVRAANSTVKCEACQDLAAAFKAGLLKTSKSNYGGGNTRWEEKSLGSYATSETRLVGIMENLCKKTRHENYCHSLVEEQEEMIENWWFQVFKNNQNSDLYEYMCIQKMDVCCPNNQYGPNCDFCKGLKNNMPCSGRGNCAGNSTKSGDGSCTCHEGYSGDICDTCAADFYDTKAVGSQEIVCKKCYQGCQSGCSGDGPLQCSECKSGWLWDAEKGCSDVNECQENNGQGSCAVTDEYCENTEGSYRCNKCDEACTGCSGGGPRKCNGCNSGYELKSDSLCEDVNECSVDSTLCRGVNENCVNLPGSYRCECITGYQRSSTQECVKIPTPPPGKAKSSNSKNDKSKKKPKRIWTKKFQNEFIKFASAIIVLGVFTFVVKGRVIPVVIAIIPVFGYLYYESMVLDSIFSRKKFVL